jgi:molybdate transport system regulatory protein
MNKDFSLNGRVWIEIDNEKILGHGRIELLERIHASGSIRQAALQMKMSYKQAWELIKHINAHFESPLVISHRGGRGGGYAEVTENGLNTIKHFHQLNKRFAEFLKTETLYFEDKFALLRANT